MTDIPPTDPRYWKTLYDEERDRSEALRERLYQSLLMRGFAQRDAHDQVWSDPSEGAVLFYGPEHYVLSNFSAFNLQWKGKVFPTSEHAYHWEKFEGHEGMQRLIEHAPSAHDAFKIAERNKSYRRDFWDADKAEVMIEILRAKVQQHEYVQRKLLETGDRELIEDAWRDDFWGWGEQRNGLNMLGKLWMEIRAELRANKERP